MIFESVDFYNYSGLLVFYLLCWLLDNRNLFFELIVFLVIRFGLDWIFKYIVWSSIYIERVYGCVIYVVLEVDIGVSGVWIIGID